MGSSVGRGGEASRPLARAADVAAAAAGKMVDASVLKSVLTPLQNQATGHGGLIEDLDRALYQLTQRVAALESPPVDLSDTVFPALIRPNANDGGFTLGPVAARRGARIARFDFTFRDRRPEYVATRTAACSMSVPAAPNRLENLVRVGFSQAFQLGGVTYEALIQWVAMPCAPTVLFVQDFHSNLWNTYGEFVNLRAIWAAA